MGSYNSAVTTTAGQSLIARAIAGNLPCTLTSAKTTAYVVPGSTSLASLTSLPDIKQNEAITSASVVSNTQVSASVRFNNTDITLNYMINTIGVYAKVQGDSSETLLAVITAIDPDVMPSYSAASPVAYVYDITLSISNASSVNIVVAPTGSPNYSEFNSVKDEVAAARVGSNDVQYSTLEDRLDTEFTDLKSQLAEWSRLDGVVIKQGTNLYPLVTEKGDGGYQSTNGVISPVTASGYAYIKMPVTEKTAYFCNDVYRWMFTVDSNGAVVDEINLPSNTFVTGNGAVECCLTYHAINHPLTSISEMVALPADADTVYMLPHNIVPDEYKPGNLFGDCGLLGTGIYVGVSSNGELDTGTNAAFNSYILPVDGISKYTFTACRFAVPLSYDRKTALVTSALANVNEIDTSSYNGCRYIAFSFNITSYPVDNYAVHKDGIIKDTYPYWTGGQPLNTLLDGITDIYPVKTPFASGIANTLADGEKVILADTMCELRKGDRVVLECDIALFSAIEIGLSDSVTSITNSHKHNYFVIDGTNISYYVSSSSTAYNVPHGLSISDNVQIVLELEKNNNLKFTLISDGQMFTNMFASTVKSKQGVWYVASNGSTLTGVKVTWSCADFRKKIWLFGDSYLGYSTSRWLYYLGQFEYDENCLINAFSGEGGGQDMVSFNTLLNYGTPKYAVWCVGMNDGSDATGEPSADWLAYVTAFIKKCRAESITPILVTIPTVPGINHEYKNAWVRTSGYRYIDFAKAVGANANGVWFSGMLSSDNVHPTEQGAKALFARALLDLPELMLKF